MKFRKDGDKVIQYDLELEYDVEKVKEGIQKLEDAVKEMESYVKIEEAKVINVQELHPIVLELKEEDVVAVCLWQESSSRVKDKTEKIKEYQELIDKANEELAEIAKLDE